jgi:hypothetical protein
LRHQESVQLRNVSPASMQIGDTTWARRLEYSMLISKASDYYWHAQTKKYKTV